jgi:hypothetical protein
LRRFGKAAAPINIWHRKKINTLHTFLQKHLNFYSYHKCDAPDHAVHSIRILGTVSMVFDPYLPSAGYALSSLHDLRDIAAR